MTNPPRKNLLRSGTRPELRLPAPAAQTRIVSVPTVWLVARESAQFFTRIIFPDISEFESYMPSHAVDLSAAPSAGRRKPLACGLVPLKTRSWSRVRDHFGDHFVRCTFAGSLSAILDKTWEDRSWMQRHFLSLLE